VSSFKKYSTIFWKFRKIHLMRKMENRSSFFFWASISTMWTIFNIFFYTTITSIRGDIGGWTQPEMMVLLSIFTLVDAFTWSVFYSNMKRYTNSVYTGEIQKVLLSPIDPQFMLMTQWQDYDNVPRLLIGAGLLTWSLNQLQISLTFFHIGIFLFLLCLGLTFMYSLWFLLSTLAFWVEKVNNLNEIIPSARPFWELPRTVYQGLFSTLFTVVLPIGVITSLPAEFLLGKSSIQLVSSFAAVTIGVFVLSRWFLHISIKRFSGVGN
jgi:ABC-2 type transport system permease protein